MDIIFKGFLFLFVMFGIVFLFPYIGYRITDGRHGAQEFLDSYKRLYDKIKYREEDRESSG
jgi:hypothetical protein